MPIGSFVWMCVQAGNKDAIHRLVSHGAMRLRPAFESAVKMGSVDMMKVLLLEESRRKQLWKECDEIREELRRPLIQVAPPSKSKVMRKRIGRQVRKQLLNDPRLCPGFIEAFYDRFSRSDYARFMDDITLRGGILKLAADNGHVPAVLYLLGLYPSDTTPALEFAIALEAKGDKASAESIRTRLHEVRIPSRAWP